MLEGQVAFYLNKYLGSYVYGLDPQSLKISVFKGDVQLNNLHLKPEALNALNLPITVKAGLLGSLTLKVPWASLGRAPVLVELDRLYLLAGPKQEFEDEDTSEEQDFEEAEQQAKRQRVADAELAATQGQSKLGEEVEKDGGGRLKAIIDTVIGNLQTSITNVHIRYEDDTSNPGMPFACGLTLEKLSAHTIDEDGNPAFVKDNPLSMLRKASQLRRFAVYFDVGKPLWQPKKAWKDMLAYDWDQLFKSGIAEGSAQQRGPQQAQADPSGSGHRMYMIKPIDGQLHYLRRGKNVRQGESEAIQEAGFDLQSIAFNISKTQYQSLQRLLDEFSAYASRAPHAHLRPKTRPQRGRAAAKWWRYAGTVVRSQQQQRLTWSNLQLVCQLRKQYIPHYIKCLHENQMGGDDYTERMDAQLPEATILLFRRLAHAKVDRERKRAAAAAARERREAASKSWFGWLRGGATAQMEENEEGVEDDPDMEGELTSADVRKLQSLVDEQEEAVQAGKETPDNLRIKINLSIGSTALVLLGSDNSTELLRAGLDGLKSIVHMYPETMEVLAAVQAVGASSPEGKLLTTGGARRQRALMRSLSSKALEGNTDQIDATSQALAVRYVQKPQDGHADTVVNLSFSPSFVTYNPVTIQNIQDFFKTGEAVDLSALGAQALAQVEKARKAVAEQLAAAMNQKPKLDLSLELDAPKIAIPVPATEDGRGKLTLVADLGQFALESDTAKANSLPIEEASLYECLKLQGSNISAYLVDGDFSFSALEEIDNRKAPTPEQGSEGGAAVSTALTAEIQQEGGKAQGGSAVFIPLLERCGIGAALQAARFPHPSLPPLRLQLQVPQLRFFFSPARLGRIMRAVEAITPAPEPESEAEEEQVPQWRISPDQVGSVRVLTWGGLARNTPQWPQRWGALYRGTLHLLESKDVAEPLESWNIWNGRRIVRVPADAMAGVQHVIGVLPTDVDVHDAKDNSDSLLLRLLDRTEADQWYRQLVRSHESMQQLVGSQDPTSPLDADWDTASVTTDQSAGQLDPEGPGWNAGKAPQPAVNLEVSAKLGELAIFVSGRTTDIWWPPEFTEDEDGEPVTAAAPAKNKIPYDQTLVNVDNEQSLVVVRASGGTTSVAVGPHNLSADVAIGSFEVEDLLVGAVCMDHSYLARSSLPAVERYHDASSELQQPDSPSGGSSGTEEEFKDAPGPEELTSLASRNSQDRGASSGQGSSGQALSLSYAKWAPHSPDHQNVDAEISVRLKTLSFFCNRPTVGALMAIGGDISAVNAAQPPDAPAAAVKQPAAEVQSKEEEDTTVDQADKGGIAKAGGSSDRVVLKVSLQLEKLEACLQYESSQAPPLGLLSVEAVAVDLTVRPDTLNATASLGNLKAQDGALPEGHQYRNICDLRRGASTSLISVEFASHSAEASHSNSRVPSGLPYSTLKARLSELDFIFLNRFVQEALQYVSVLLVLRPAPLEVQAQDTGVPALATASTAPEAEAGAEPRAEAAAAAGPAPASEGAQEVGMVLQMDIDMEAPVISMPRNSDSQDCVQIDLGSFSLHNSLKWIGGSGTSDPKAVLIEHDDVAITDLSAMVTSNGQKGDNLIKDYNQGMEITLRRPIYNPHLLVPNLDVAVSIPSIKTVLSDQEYQLISSMAGDNFAEPLKVPPAAQWLQQYYTTAQEATVPAGEAEEADAADSSKPASKQEQFKQAVRDSGNASARDNKSKPSEGEEEEKTAMRVLLNMGRAEVELVQGSSDNPSHLKPLARFLVGGLWISYQMTHTGTMRLALSLPRVEAVDLRPWIPPEHALVISSEHTNPDGSYRAAQEAKTVAWPPPSNSPAHLMKPSFLTVELTAQQSLSRQKVQVRLQRPTVVAEVGFMLSVAKFFVPGFAMSGLVPLPFESNDIVLTGTAFKADRDVWLSPEARLLADSPGIEDFTYDGQGRRLVLPQDISVEEPLPLILIGPGKTLQLKNVKLVHSASLPACLQLGPGAQLMAHPADNVEKIEGGDDSDPSHAALSPSVKASGQVPRAAAAAGATSGSLVPGTLGRGKSGAVAAKRPVAPDLVADATNAAVAAAASAVDLSCLQLDVVAVGMGLRFVEIETVQQTPEATGKEEQQQRSNGKHSVRMLAASLDLAASYKVEGDEQTAQAELRGLKLVTQINLGRSDPTASSQEKSMDSNIVQGSILEPCRIGIDMKMRNGTGDFNLSLSDLKLNLAPDILELVQSLQSSVLEPLVQPSADQPMAKCTRFSQLWSNRPSYGSTAEASCDAHVLGGDRGVTFWRPQPPLGYAILGDCITAGSTQPAFQVLALAVNSGLVAFPTSYSIAWSAPGIHLWRPTPPEGYLALGCLATPSSDPPGQTAMVCIHKTLGVGAPLGQCLAVKPQNVDRRASGDVGHLSEAPGANVWCVDNAAATFTVCTAQDGANPTGPLYDLRSPLGVTPAALKALRAGPQTALQGLRPAKEQGFQAYQSFRKTRANLLKTQIKKRLKAVAVDFKRIWWDKGVREGSREGAGIWRPVPPSGYVSLGDCLAQGFSPPESAIVIQDSIPGDDQKGGVPLLRPPRGYERVFQDETSREDKQLSLWKPIPMPGYVAVGYVANLGSRAPSRQVVRCVRADAVTAVAGYTGRATWQLPQYRNRPALAVWASDDRLGTFVAGQPRSPPLPQDIYRLRLLDQEDEQSAQDQLQSGSQGSGMNMVLHAGSVSVVVRDALRRPLAELELGKVNGALRSLPTRVMQAYIGFSSSIWSYNAGVTAWEPVMEPWDIIFKLDANPNPLAAYGVLPGNHISIKSNSHALHLTLAYAAVSSFVAAIQEWRDLHGAKGDETFKRQLAAADAAKLHTIVDNKLGIPARMELDFGDHMETTEIPAKGSVPVVQPLSQPPLRHSKSLQTAPEAQPAALLLVDVMSASGLPNLAPPADNGHGSSDEFTDAEGAKSVVCSLEFMDTLNDATSGVWGVRTRAITANKEGTLEWVERLILELKGPIGTAGRLRVQLTDTAANSSKHSQLATAEVSLDMRQWQDSQTYQAQVALQPSQGDSSGEAKLLLRYTLQQQHQQEPRAQQHTDAWLDTASTAGQRALQVGQDPKWVVIPSSGLQRNAANVGAGGMVKKNLPEKHHKRKTAAAVLPVRVGDEGVALESSFKNGIKNEVLRSLCQLVNSSELALEVSVVESADAEWSMLPRQARSISSDQVQMQRQHSSSLNRRGSGVDVTEEQIFEHERFMPLAGWSSRNLLPTERNRYSRAEDGSQSSNVFPQIRLSEGWEWESPWEVELSSCVDKEGWAYAPDWAAMDWPPQHGAQKRGVVDFTRRRRWLRRRRLDLTRPSPQQQPHSPATRLQATSRRTTSIKAIATEAAKKEVQRTVLGIVQPGDTLPVPYGWQRAGKQLAVRPVLDQEASDTHGWSVGASDGDHNIHLDALEEGLTRLVAALPSAEAESKGKEAVTQDDSTLASKLAASPVWLSLTVDAETFPATGQQEYKPLMDWKVVAAAPLVIENQLPVKGTYLIWETPREPGSNLVLRQSGHINSGERVHIYSADMRRTVSLQFYPDGYELVEPQPVLISQGYSSPQAGAQGRQKLPERFLVQRAGGEPQEIFLDRDIDMEAWQMNDKQLDPGAAVARGSPLLVRMLVPLWMVNATSLPIAAIVVATQPPPKPKEGGAGGEPSGQGGLQSAADSVKLRVIETRPREANLQNPRGCRQVGPGAVTMMAYPMQRMEAFKQQGDRPMQYFGLCLRIGESGWAPPLPLESSDNSNQSEDLNTKPVLLRARIPEWGTVHEVVVRVDMAGSGFERTMVLRLEPHVVVSNRTGIPLQLMHYSSAASVQRLGSKATGVQPSRGQQPQRAAPGLKGVVARPDQDWTSCIDVPSGSLGLPLHWSMKSESRAVCLRFAPPTAGSGEGSPWSHPLEASFPGGVDRHVAIPVQPPTPSQTAKPGDAQSAEEADQQSEERSVATLLTGTGPSWELHGPRVARRLRHSSSRQAGPDAMTEVEVVILRFSLGICNPGCLHLVLESVSPKPPYLLENRTGHPFQYRQAGIGDLPFQPLPAYSAAGFAWQITEKCYPREVEVQEAYGKQPPQRYPLDPPEPKSVTGADASTHNRGMGGPLPKLPLSVQPGECLVQIVDREQELMSTAGLQTIGGGGGLGRGGLDRELRIVPSRKGPNGELAVLGLSSADDMSGRALHIAVSFDTLDISCVDHVPDELIAITIEKLSFSGALGIGPEGTFQRMQLSVQKLQIDDQLPSSRFPVVLSPAGASEGYQEGLSDPQPLIALTVISQPGLARGQTYYPLISFQISKPLQVSLSETLVWRAAEMVQRLDLASLSSGEEDIHAETATDVPMQMSLVSISNLSAKVSFRGDLAARPRWAGRTLSWALDMANFENVPVQLTGFEMENSTMLWSVFISQVLRNIQGQLMGVALSFLRNFGILSGASGVLGALSSGVASAALDDRFAVQRAQQKQERSIEGVGDGMVEGGAALGMGIYRGFTGLVSKPIEGAKSKGVGGFFKGVGKGVIGAVAQPLSGGLDFASSAFEGIDATKDQLIGRPRAGMTNKRLRLPRAIGGDGKVTAFIGTDGTEKQARVEEVGQALLRRVQDVQGLGPRRKGKRSQYHLDAYEEHMLLPEDQVVILTNKCIMKLRAPGFAQVHKAAETGNVSTGWADVPPAEVRWAIPWQDLLTLELHWSSRERPYPDRLTVHRKGRPGQQEEEPLAHELRCWSNIPQADQINLIALKVQRKYYTEPRRDTQRWQSRHDQLLQGSQGLPKQELPATMLSMDFKRIWITDRRNIQQCVSFWQPVAPPGYLPLGHVPYIGLDPPADPVLVYRDDSSKGKNPPVKPAREFQLIWRQNGQSPVTMWEPLPPQGYRALGTVVVPAAEQPGPNEVLCVREDLCAKSGLFDSAIWKYEPTVMQAGLNVQRLKTYYPETWRCSCWQVDNPAGTFLANRSLNKPSQQAAFAASGLPSK